MLVLSKGLVNNLEKLLQYYKCDMIDEKTTVEKMIEIIERNEAEEKTPSPVFIRDFVVKHLGADPYYMSAASRKREHVAPRQIAMYLCHKHCDRERHPLKVIGKVFGGRDHSTVIYAFTTVSDMIDVDKKFKKEVLVTEEEMLNEFKFLNSKFDNQA